MASMILKASRGAASAARSTASRCAAAVSRSGLVVAAASDPLLPRRSSLSLYRSGSTIAGPPLFDMPGQAPGKEEEFVKEEFVAEEKDLELKTLRALYEEEEFVKEEFVAEEKDLESDETLWALYERWCKAFNEERSPDEMALWFGTFKQTVLMVDSNKKARLPYRLEINMFADGKKIQLVCPKRPPFRTNDSPRYVRPYGYVLRRHPS